VKIILLILIVLAIVAGLIWWVMKSGADDTNDDY